MSANKYEPLSMLKPARYDYKIKVRIIRKWRGVTRTGEEFKSFNVILIDNKRTRIHAFIPSLVAEDQDNKLKVRSVCIIQNFTIQPYKPDDKFRCLRNENQLIFSKDTKIEDGEDNGTEVPLEAFDFHDHSELKALTKQITYLADVVGIIKNHDPFKTNVKNRLGQMNNQAKFTITDGSSNIKVTFWDKFGEQFEKAMQEATEKPVIVIIASCKVGWWNDDVDLGSVTSTTFYLNYNHHSVMQLRKRLSNPDFFKQVFATSQKKKVQLLTILQMKNLYKDYIESEVIIHANIRSVEDTGKWYCNACPGCYNETEIISQELFCSKCNKRVPSPDKKFKIFVLASDKTGEVQVVLGDREVRTLVGKRVHQIIKENGDDIFPQIVKDIANQHYTLKIRLKEMNIVDHIQVYSATNICHGFKNPQDEETEDTAQTSNKATSSTYNIGECLISTPNQLR